MVTLETLFEVVTKLSVKTQPMGGVRFVVL